MCASGRRAARRALEDVGDATTIMSADPLGRPCTGTVLRIKSLLGYARASHSTLSRLAP
jgi:hypothetical protein